MSAPREMPTPPKPPIAIKGRGRDLRIAVEDAAPAGELVESLRQQLARRAGGFFAGAPVTLEMPAAPLDMALATRLAAVIDGAGMTLAAIVQRDAPPARPRDRGPGGGEDTRPAPDAEGALVVERTLRGGQRVTHEGDIVILGDVNPGAEVVAGGSVLVWGRLRGTVDAGRRREGAAVRALDLAPTQLRIGAAIARAPEDPQRVPEPEVAREGDGRIVVDVWR